MWLAFVWEVLFLIGVYLVGWSLRLRWEVGCLVLGGDRGLCEYIEVCRKIKIFISISVLVVSYRMVWVGGD